jgi:transposase
VDGESAATIAERFDRTQQTITAWLRQAAGEMREYFEYATG